MSQIARRTLIDSETIKLLKTPSFKAYAQQYVDIEKDLAAQIRAMGVSIAERRESPLHTFARSAGMQSCDICIRNDARSACRGWISPACETCRAGIGTRTFYINAQCNRNCFFCFNPNQREYDQRDQIKHDIVAELEEVVASGKVLNDIALTGGEPLLFPDETIAFFTRAYELFPHAYTRLYTNGDFADESMLRTLGEAGLQEIRFSVKQENTAVGYVDDSITDRIISAKRFIPRVLVEMPALPNDQTNMEQLLIALDIAGCDGINLLELCFPFHNWSEFARRGYQVKNPPLRVPYSYGYAGGLPIDGSEDTCLALLVFAERIALRMGVHYCSLESKFTSQIHLQNAPYSASVPTCILSNRDFFLKSCKVFGEDAKTLVYLFEQANVSARLFVLAQDSITGTLCLDFNPSLVSLFAKTLPQLELAICYRVVEQQEGGFALRELALDAMCATDFDLDRDI